MCFQTKNKKSNQTIQVHQPGAHEKILPSRHHPKCDHVKPRLHQDFIVTKVLAIKHEKFCFNGF